MHVSSYLELESCQQPLKSMKKAIKIMPMYMYIFKYKDRKNIQPKTSSCNQLHCIQRTHVQYLYNILNRDIFLQVVLAIGLQSIVCESIERGSREEVQGILWGHGHISIIDKLQ